LITGSILYWVGKSFGFANLLVWYILPYLWVNHWLG
jgi:omega-6 fatty acid desaturase (delta-12 desaturase)